MVVSLGGQVQLEGAVSLVKWMNSAPLKAPRTSEHIYTYGWMTSTRSSTYSWFWSDH